MSKTASLENEIYFLTSTIINWIDLFTRQEYFNLIVDNLIYCQKRKGLEIYEYVIMTNHLHLIASGNEQPLSNIIRDFKTFTSKKLFQLVKDDQNRTRSKWIIDSFEKAGKTNILNTNFQVWQNFNYPTLLDNVRVISQKIEYIHQNPVLAGFVNDPSDYYYSSANSNSPIMTLEL